MADAAWKKLKDKVTAKKGKKRDAGGATVTGSLDLEFHYFSLYQEIYYFSVILLLIFLRLGISRFDLASLCIA